MLREDDSNDASSGSGADNLGAVTGGAIGDSVQTVSDDNVLVPILVRVAAPRLAWVAWHAGQFSMDFIMCSYVFTLLYTSGKSPF
jgi:hypothetical protein